MKKRLSKLAVISMLAATVSAVPAYAGTWQQDDTGWWYENDDGSHQRENWFQDADGTWYYFNESGYMLTNTNTPDGCFVGVDGAWVRDGVASGATTETTNDSEYPLKGTVEYMIIEDGTVRMFTNSPEYAQMNIFRHNTGRDFYPERILLTLAGLDIGESLTADEEPVAKEVKKFLASFDWKSMNDYDKAAYTARYINDRCEYKTVDGTTYEANSPYSCLVKGVGVCDGMAATYHLLSRAVGVKSFQVGNLAHSWNYVLIDGTYYRIDTTSLSDRDTASYNYTLNNYLNNPATNVEEYIWILNGTELLFYEEYASQPLY